MTVVTNPWGEHCQGVPTFLCVYVIRCHLLLQEFVKWVFAEEQTISSGTTGKFKLRVSGCSRPELNGDYVQQKEFYYRRPIFHCIENERYLFYHGKRHSAAQELQIHTHAQSHAHTHTHARYCAFDLITPRPGHTSV